MDSSEVKYPWPSTVNVANFVTVKPSLKEEERLRNFNIWKEQMLCLVESQDVLGFINGEILERQSSNVETEQKLWRRTDRLVKGWILGSIGKDALDAVWELETARKVWLELDKIFNEKAANPEIHPESDANAQEEGGETSASVPTTTAGGDLGRHVPLYKAALRGDWETAEIFFDNDKEKANAIITCFSETALHVAILTGKANDFVKKLVELLPADALALKDQYGATALHKAAVGGNKEAAITLVNKNPDLLYILNNRNRLPILQAAIYCRKDTLEYLISASKPNVKNTPFERPLGVELLSSTIHSEFFDIALDLVLKYPDLARFTSDVDANPALITIAGMGSAFPSAERFSWWEKLIYRVIPLKQRKCKAAQATSLAGDIENVSRNAPAYKKYCSSFQIISAVALKLEFMLWNVIQHLVPQVKGIRDKKAKHQQALELVKCLCEKTVSLPGTEASSMFWNTITKAAKHGISEIMEMIMEMYPVSVYGIDVGTGMNITHLAASYRFEKVFNLFYSMSDRKYQFIQEEDNEGNNLMHICGKLAPPDRLNLVRGAALQMQRELQWFKEMEKILHPSRRRSANKKNQTPKMLFTMEHQRLKAEGEKWMKDTANACTIAAALIATVMFAAAFTVPGGVVTETGIPIFLNESEFVLFAVSDAVSLFTSITSLLMFLSILTSRYAEEDFLYVLPKRLSIGLLSLFISITFMMFAFSATLHLAVRRKMSWFFIPVAALACLPVTSFVLLQFPLLVDVVYSTYGPGIFGKKSDHLLY